MFIKVKTENLIAKLQNLNRNFTLFTLLASQQLGQKELRF